MKYKVFILKRAQKELAQINTEYYEKIKEVILKLQSNPRPGCKKLVARDGWRIRVGIYRIIYEIDDKEKTVTILNIGERRDIYR